MAKTYYAATKIKYGERTEDGSQEGKYEPKTFERGDNVTGLSAATMKGLWEAGALTDQPPADAEDSKEEETTEDTSKTPSTPKPTKSVPPKA